jgi:hypothetical protein
MWESIICYEDRSKYSPFYTSRWRLSGIRTKVGAENTDSGVLWLSMVRANNIVTATLYKDDGLATAAGVATGSADISHVDGIAANAAQVELKDTNGSGIDGSFWIHQYIADGVCPVQVALCTDEDLESLWDGIDSLTGYNATGGMAEFIRVAGEDVLARITRLFEDALGAAAPDAWFIRDAERTYPDLRRLANPGQLRLACACRVLQLALGRQHDRADNTAFSVLRDSFGKEFEAAMQSVRLALRTGPQSESAVAKRQTRV